MEQLYLRPGQEHCEKFRDGNRVPKVRFSTARSTVRCSTASAAVWRKPSACARIGSSGRIAATATKTTARNVMQAFRAVFVFSL